MAQISRFFVFFPFRPADPPLARSRGRSGYFGYSDCGVGETTKPTRNTKNKGNKGGLSVRDRRKRRRKPPPYHLKGGEQGENVSTEQRKTKVASQAWRGGRNEVMPPKNYIKEPQRNPIQSPYIYPGNYRPFKVIQGNTIKLLANSHEPHI